MNASKAKWERINDVSLIDGMKVCYCDESGMVQSDPFATMAGIVVDAQRMHVTIAGWEELLSEICELANRNVVELKTSDFYRGKGIWKSVDGEIKSQIVRLVLDFLAKRKHRIIFTALDRKAYLQGLKTDEIPDELSTEWRFMGFHLILGLQKAHKGEKPAQKGHTLLVFDNREHDKIKFSDMIARPGSWSDEYYSRQKKQEQLSHIVDVPYFGDSKDIPLLQVADFLAFMLRRYAEIEAGVGSKPFTDEAVKLRDWVISDWSPQDASATRQCR